MTKQKLLVFLSLLTTALTAYASVSLADNLTEQPVICSATLNSSDEIETLKQKLGSRDFKYVELTKLANPMSSGGSSSWFDAACQQNIKCDVLLISAHFGGEFFGASQKYTLELRTLERHSCQKTCDGVLGHLKEVYLFGCNTLAGKEKDSRTPEQYRDRLQEEGIVGVQADQVVAGRYGPFGSAYKDQMERNFEGVPIIYGFNSVAPSGQNVRSSFAKYLDSIGDFRTHLETINSSRNLSHDTWMKTMSAYNRATGVGLLPTNSGYAIKTNMCKLDDDRLPFSDRLNFAATLLSNSPMLYLPEVARFINYARETFGPNASTDTVAAVRSFNQNFQTRGQVEKLMAEPNLSLTEKIEFLQMRQKLGWMTDSQFAVQARIVLDQVLVHPTIQTADSLCSLLSEHSDLKKYIDSSAVSKFAFHDPSEFQLASCLRTNDTAITRAALGGFSQIQSHYAGDMSWVMMAIELSQLPGLRAEKLQTLRAFLPQLKWHGGYSIDYVNAIVLATVLDPDEQLAFLEKLRPKLIDERFANVCSTIGMNPNLADAAVVYCLKNSDPNDIDSFVELIRNSKVVEDTLAEMYERLTEDAKFSLLDGLSSNLPIRSEALLSALIRDLAKVQKNSLTSKHLKMAYIIGQSKLTDAQYNQVLLLYKSDESGDASINLPYLRYILFHARDHREIDQRFLVGPRNFESCQKTEDGGLECRSQTE